MDLEQKLTVHNWDGGPLGADLTAEVYRSRFNMNRFEWAVVVRDYSFRSLSNNGAWTPLEDDEETVLAFGDSHTYLAAVQNSARALIDIAVQFELEHSL